MAKLILAPPRAHTVLDPPPHAAGNRISRHHPSLTTYIQRAQLWFYEGLHVNLAKRSLVIPTRTQGHVMSYLSLGEQRATRLARNVGITPQAMSQVLVEMTAIGWVSIERDPEDARARVVRLTESGLRHQAQVRIILGEMETMLEQRFGRAVVDVLRMVFETEWGDPPLVDVDAEDEIAAEPVEAEQCAR